MTEEKVVEAELNDSVMSDVSDAITVIVDETVKLFDSLGKALVTTMQDVSNLMIIKVNADTREHLDLLVDAGVAQSRGKAATQLIEQGITATEITFDRIRSTQARITELHRQMRSLVKIQA